MKRYLYTAKDAAGKLIKGEVEAASEKEAVGIIQKQNLLVLSIKPVSTNPFSALSKVGNKVSAGEVALLTRQLATMVNAGLPITESLLILRTQSKGILQQTVSQMLADIEGGGSLSATFAKHPKLFSPTYIALLKAGETGGVMDKVLIRLADNLEKEQEFKSKVKGALIYPVIIIIGMIAVSLIFMLVVMPKLSTLYGSMNISLPFSTKLLIAVSNILFKLWPLLIIVAVGAVFGFNALIKTKAGRARYDKFILKVPIYGVLQKQIVLTELTRTLSLMVGAGVSIMDGLNITAGVVGNRVIADALDDAARQVQRGFPIAYAFAKHAEAFPFILSQMIAVGEETGKMEEILSKVSHIFEIEADQKVKGLTAAIEPIVMVILGLGVAFLVMAVIMPIYSLTSAF